MRKVIFDTDIGTDDAVALMALLLADDIDVIGVTTVFGNRPVENTTDNALRMIEFLGKDVPVYKGCSSSLVRSLTPGRDMNTLMQCIVKQRDGKEVRIHEETLQLPAASKKEQAKHACSYIVETLLASRQPIDICAVGPLTNIAVAIKMNPEIVNKIGTMYIMGGGLFVGNRTPVAEANFYDDPEAAEIVLNCGAHIVLGPIEGNEDGATYTQQDINDIEAIDNKTAIFTAKLLRDFIERCQFLFAPEIDSCCIHDYAGIVPIIDSETVTDLRREICHVDISGGMSDGQLVCDRRGYDTSASNVEVVYKMDSEKVHKILLDLISKAN